MIAAEGEQKASKALRMAAETISDSHGALQVLQDRVSDRETKQQLI